MKAKIVDSNRKTAFPGNLSPVARYVRQLCPRVTLRRHALHGHGSSFTIAAGLTVSIAPPAGFRGKFHSDILPVQGLLQTVPVAYIE